MASPETKKQAAEEKERAKQEAAEQRAAEQRAAEQKDEQSKPTEDLPSPTQEEIDRAVLRQVGADKPGSYLTRDVKAKE